MSATLPAPREAASDPSPPPARRRERARAAAVYLGAAVLSVIAVIIVLELWRADLWAPFEYGQDVLSYQMVCKAVMERGWYLTNPLLGMPAGLELHEFPFVIGDSFHLLVIKLMGLFTRSSALAMNLYFLLSFPLTTLATMAALRRLGVSWAASVAAGLLYAFLPFRTQRQEIHIFMACYYAVPLMVLVMLWLGERQALFTRPLRRRTVASVAICVLVSATGLYQAFFAMVLLAVAGAVAAVRFRSGRHALATLVLFGTLIAGLGVAALPVVLHRLSHGPNRAVAHRSFKESEVYALKPAYLVLPVRDHRFRPLARLAAPVYQREPLEGSTMALGTVGALGFLGLLAALMLRSGQAVASLRDRLADLNITALLFATVSGFSLLFALFVTPQFRGHNRISVYIGCFGLFAVALAMDRFGRRWGSRWAAGLAAAVTLFGLWDQTNRAQAREYVKSARSYHSDAALVRTIEGRLPRGAMVFQLPYVEFPEASYDQLRPYFHSETLRWSFPTMRARPNAAWQLQMATRAPDQLVEGLAHAGFDGILIHRFAMRDRDRWESQLTSLLGSPIVSADGQFSFFDLSAHRRRLASPVHPSGPG